MLLLLYQNPVVIVNTCDFLCMVTGLVHCWARCCGDRIVRGGPAIRGPPPAIAWLVEGGYNGPREAEPFVRESF